MVNKFRHPLDHTIRIISIALVFVGLGSYSAYAQGLEVSTRPSFSLVVLESATNASAANRWNHFDFARSHIADRADPDLFKVLPLRKLQVNTEKLFETDKNGNRIVSPDVFRTAVLDVALASALDKHILNHLFMVDDQFVWSLDRLIERAQYAQTAAEAAVDMTSLRGGLNQAASNSLDHVTRAYAILLLPEVGDVEYTVTEDGREVKRRREYTKYHSSLLRLDIDSVGEVKQQLSAFYCEANCSNRAAKQEAYATAHFPFELLWSDDITSTETGDEELEDVLSQVIDEVVRDVPALQNQAFVLDEQPIISRLGKKDGVKIGRRYEVVRQIEENGERKRKRRGYVRASKVVDNRGGVIRRTASGTEEIIQYPPSVFKQVHGRNIDPFDVLVEKPDLGFTILSSYRQGTYSAFGLDVLYRIPGTFATLAGLSGELFFDESDELAFYFSSFSNNELAKWMTLRGGIVLAQEFMLARGNFRLMPYVGGLYQLSTPTSTIDDEDDTELKIESLGYRAGMNGTLQVAYRFGVYVGASYQGLLKSEFDDASGDKQSFSWSDLFDKGTGLQFEGGIRINM